MRFSRPLRLTLTLLYFVTCNVLFLLPGKAFPEETWLNRIYFDKWVHIGLFALLALLLRWSGLLRARIAAALALLAAYGLLVEILQGAFVPNRSFDGWDLLADAVGALLGLLAWRRWWGRLKF